MNIKTLAAAAVTTAALIAPTAASAHDLHLSHYYITQDQAEMNVADAAEYRYSGNGVTVDDAYCAPQGTRMTRSTPRHFYGAFHRWACTWTGTDEDGADVYGQFRITGHSDHTYGYKAVRGGLHWM